MDVLAQPVERDPRVDLRAEAVVRVELGARALDAGGRQRADDGRQDQHDGHELEQRRAPFAPEDAGEMAHRACFVTSASAARAASSLCLPTPHSTSARWSTTISVWSASAPCHQPNLAPATMY